MMGLIFIIVDKYYDVYYFIVMIVYLHILVSRSKYDILCKLVQLKY
jgi:hypothetical protein